jgi:hypothetical protein
MILLSQSYTASSDERNIELQRCRLHNEELGLFDRVEYLDGRDRTLSFSELYEHCLKKYRGQWCVIANSDITFNTTAYMLKGLKKPGRLVALTRWEDYHGPRFIGHVHGDKFYSGSQDSWAFLSGELAELDETIPLGTIGCDQVIAGWACRNGVEVIDPALSIKTTHVHSINDRPDDRPALNGFFGYPHLTTMATTGEVLCHDWPRSDGEWEFEWQLLRSAK